MKAQPRNKKVVLPDFDKMPVEEEALWWETHDTADYWEEFKEVDVKFAPDAFKVPEKLKKLSSAINIKLDLQNHVKLHAIAQKKGIGVSTLARKWILEQIHGTEQALHA